MSDFSSVPTDVLRRETLQRARLVNKVNGEIFEALGGAWLGSMPWCFLAVAVLADTLGDRTEVPWWVYALLVSLGLFGVPFIRRWMLAARACKAFTAEMRARKAELDRRRGAA